MSDTRKPPEGRQGMELGAYLHVDEIGALDNLARHWGVKRNRALRMAILEAHEAVFAVEPPADHG